MPRRARLAIILNAHLPYVRHLELPWCIEEAWLFEALLECYLPLLEMLDRLLRDRVEFRLAVGITPTLAAMLEDPRLRERFREHLSRLEELCAREALRLRHVPDQYALIVFYRQRLARLRRFYERELSGDVVRAFGMLAEQGSVECFASAATHALLPSLRGAEEFLRAQVRLGVRALGRKSAGGFWLPECGYCPGLDRLLAEEGVRWVVLEAGALARAEPPARYGVYAPVALPSGVIALARDPLSSRQVWSAHEGYPGDPEYREFHRDIGFDLPLAHLLPVIGEEGSRVATGLKYHRVTGRDAHKEIYRPPVALERAKEHARHFLESRGAQVDGLAAHVEGTPLFVTPFDAELFGHWWFEGGAWLEEVLRLSAEPRFGLETVTPSQCVEDLRDAQTVQPPLSTWGTGGSTETWINEGTSWIHSRLERAAEPLVRLARAAPASWQRPFLEQAARELLLAQASDWPFIINAGTSSEYAHRRLTDHLDAAETLVSVADGVAPKVGDDALYRERLARWPIFPDLRVEDFVIESGSARVL